MQATKKKTKRTASKRARKTSATAAPNVNDAIDHAFAELNASGIVAMQGVGYTMSDGWDDVNEIASERRPVPRGATFFHRQDKARAKAGEGLMLTFGAYEDEPRKRKAASLRIAREICEVLVRHGVKARWDGSVDTRIRIPPFAWKRR